jgi:hypothetical protein
LDTAIRSARRCPITTTSVFPRVMPVSVGGGETLAGKNWCAPNVGMVE